MPEIICQNCGSIDDYHTIMKSNQNTAWCNGCDRFIKNIPQNKPPVIHFGKYKGRLISSLTLPADLQYLQWVSTQEWCATLLKSQILSHIDNLSKK